METRKIPGYPGYLARDDGRIIGKRGRPMGNGPAERGEYVLIRPVVNGKALAVRTHVLVCLAFHGPAPPGHEVDHIDRDKGNNRPENLRWLTHLENCRRRKTAAYVAGVRRRLKLGQTGRSIAELYGISESMVSRIKNGSRWAQATSNASTSTETRS